MLLLVVQKIHSSTKVEEKVLDSNGKLALKAQRIH